MISTSGTSQFTFGRQSCAPQRLAIGNIPGQDGDVRQLRPNMTGKAGEWKGETFSWRSVLRLEPPFETNGQPDHRVAAWSQRDSRELALRHSKLCPI